VAPQVAPLVHARVADGGAVDGAGQVLRDVVDVDLDGVGELLDAVVDAVGVVERAEQVHDEHADPLGVGGLARRLAPLEPVVGGPEQADEVGAQQGVDGRLVGDAAQQGGEVGGEEAPGQEGGLARQVGEERERRAHGQAALVGQPEQVVDQLDALGFGHCAGIVQQRLDEQAPVLRVVVDSQAAEELLSVAWGEEKR